MHLTYCGFVDVGFLHAQAAATLGRPRTQCRLDAGEVVSWLRGLPSCKAPFLRAYWYDGAYDSRHPKHVAQQYYFDTMAATPGLHLRLGHLQDRGTSRIRGPFEQALAKTAAALKLNEQALLAEFSRHWTWKRELTQKGVDTLIALDLVRLAERGVYQEAVLVAGDRDLAEAVRTAQDAGRRVTIATPSLKSVAQELLQIADEVVVIDKAALQGMLVGRPVAGGVMTR